MRSGRIFYFNATCLLALLLFATNAYAASFNLDIGTNGSVSATSFEGGNLKSQKGPWPGPDNFNVLLKGTDNGNWNVLEGTDITFSFEPNDYYQIKDVLLDGDSVGSVGTLTLDDTGDHDIAVAFEAAPVEANFSVSPASGKGEAGHPVQFTDTSTNIDISTPGATTWSWSFVNNNTLHEETSTEQNPAHIFATAGNYIVTLTVTNNLNGRTDSTEPIVYSAVEPTITYQASAGPNGIISPAGTLTVPEGTSTTFTFTPDTHYQMDKVLVDDHSIDPVPSSLTFDGLTDLRDHTIFASFKPIKVIASFTATTDNGLYEANYPIKFEDTSVNNPTSWAWDFGDGNTSITRHPEHRYASAGVYIVTLTVENDANQTVDTVPMLYEVVDPTITYQASAGPNGTISPAGTLTATEGTSTTFTFTPDINYQVADVLIDGEGVGSFTSWTFDGTTDLKDHSISVSFEPISTAGILLKNSSQSYDLLQAAYDGAFYSGLSEETIMLKAEKIVDEVYLYFDKNISINLIGGYDTTFESNTSFTRIDANVIISDGKVTISNIVIGPAI